MLSLRVRGMQAYWVKSPHGGLGLKWGDLYHKDEDVGRDKNN